MMVKVRLRYVAACCVVLGLGLVWVAGDVRGRVQAIADDSAGIGWDDGARLLDINAGFTALGVYIGD